jgi:hypothetical protein
MALTGTRFTTTAIEPDTLPTIAVIIAFPALTAVTVPASTVAMLGSLERHVKLAVVTTTPAAVIAVARILAVCPS